MSNVLHTDNITMQFGGLKAVSDLSLEINQGGIIGLIGPNGAGKTTVFNMITGVYTPTSGKVIFNDQYNCTGYSPNFSEYQAVSNYDGDGKCDDIQTCQAQSQSGGGGAGTAPLQPGTLKAIR